MTCFARQNMDFILIMLCAKMASSVSDLDDIAIALCLFYCQRTQNLTSLSTSTASLTLITNTWYPYLRRNCTANRTILPIVPAAQAIWRNNTGNGNATIENDNPHEQANASSKKDKDKIRSARSRIVREWRGFPSSLTAAWVFGYGLDFPVVHW